MNLFTIIIPTFNSEQYIGTCLQSIVNQDCDDFEVLILDGLSGDNTVKIAAGIAAAHPEKRIRIISEKDSGIYDAMNKGLRLATCEWVYFLGSDDHLYSRDVLSKIKPVALSGGYDVIYGNVFHEDFKKIYDGEFNDEKICRDGICHQSIFYKRQLLLDRGGYRTDMKAYAHIYLDKILFTDNTVHWKFLDLVIASYAGRGFSRTHFDEVYWNQAEKLLNDHFKNRVSRKVIYESLEPLVENRFSAKSFMLSLRIAFYTHTLSPIGKWFAHPVAIARLTFKKLIPR